MSFPSGHLGPGRGLAPSQTPSRHGSEPSLACRPQLRKTANLGPMALGLCPPKGKTGQSRRTPGGPHTLAPMALTPCPTLLSQVLTGQAPCTWAPHPPPHCARAGEQGGKGQRDQSSQEGGGAWDFLLTGGGGSQRRLCSEPAALVGKAQRSPGCPCGGHCPGRRGGGPEPLGSPDPSAPGVRALCAGWLRGTQPPHSPPSWTIPLPEAPRWPPGCHPSCQRLGAVEASLLDGRSWSPAQDSIIALLRGQAGGLGPQLHRPPLPQPVPSRAGEGGSQGRRGGGCGCEGPPHPLGGFPVSHGGGRGAESLPGMQGGLPGYGN